MQQHVNKSTGQEKMAFDSRESCQEYIDFGRLTGVVPYYCEECQKWHFGHPKNVQVLEVNKALKKQREVIGDLKWKIHQLTLENESLQAKVSSLTSQVQGLSGNTPVILREIFWKSQIMTLLPEDIEFSQTKRKKNYVLRKEGTETLLQTQSLPEVYEYLLQEFYRRYPKIPQYEGHKLWVYTSKEGKVYLRYSPESSLEIPKEKYVLSTSGHQTLTEALTELLITWAKT